MPEYTLGLRDGTQGQVDFYGDDTHRHPALVSGFGGGKTYAGCQKLLRLAVKNYAATGKKHTYACIEPDMPMIQKILMPTLIEEILEPAGIPHNDRSGNQTKPHIYIPSIKAKFVLIGGNLPKKIVGFDCAGAYVDEAHLMPQLAWTNINNRLRDKFAPLMQIFATFTPEIPAWTHDKWGCMEISNEPLPKGYCVYNSSSRDNVYLPDGYIDGVLAECEEGMEHAVVEGHFVVSKSGKVYATFDPLLNKSDMARYDPALQLGVTFDFNPGAAGVTILLVQQNGPAYFVVDEINLKGHTLEESCGEVLARYQHLQKEKVSIYGDASGRRSTSQNAEYDIIKKILSSSGFIIKDKLQSPFDVPVSMDVPLANPSVSDSCATIRTLLCNSTGYRQLYLNPRCKKLLQDMRSVVYKSYWMAQNGKVHLGGPYEIYKGDIRLTHASDALRYWISRVAPKRNQFRRQTGFNVK